MPKPLTEEQQEEFLAKQPRNDFGHNLPSKPICQWLLNHEQVLRISGAWTVLRLRPSEVYKFNIGYTHEKTFMTIVQRGNQPNTDENDITKLAQDIRTGNTVANIGMGIITAPVATLLATLFIFAFNNTVVDTYKKIGNAEHTPSITTDPTLRYMLYGAAFQSIFLFCATLAVVTPFINRSYNIKLPYQMFNTEDVQAGLAKFKNFAHRLEAYKRTLPQTWVDRSAPGGPAQQGDAVGQQLRRRENQGVHIPLPD